jgi:AcrR family transcriptional regulator
MADAAPPARRRDPLRTKRALLDAAASSVVTHGAGVSVDVIARTAGVSKSGLLHHFLTKEQLFAALAQDAFDRFAVEAEAAVEADDLAPGRLLRGYLRATFAQATDPDAADYWAVMAHLAVVPAVAEAARADFRFWEGRLTADGFDPAVAQLVLLAANGLELGEAVGWVPGGDRDQLRDRLLKLTRAADTVRDVLLP